VPKQTRTTVRTRSYYSQISLYVIPNNKCSVRTNQSKGQNMLLLSVEQDITIARTTFYYIQNNFVCHLDKKIKCYNKREQLSEQDPIIAKNKFECHLE
jgi:hypothetical protein